MKGKKIPKADLEVDADIDSKHEIPEADAEIDDSSGDDIPNTNMEDEADLDSEDEDIDVSGKKAFVEAEVKNLRKWIAGSKSERERVDNSLSLVMQPSKYQILYIYI